jgi:hypothetical protein
MEQLKPKKRKRLNGKDSYTHCLTCKEEFNTIGSKGKLVKYQASGTCRTCYNKAYNKSDRYCLKCQRPLVNTTKTICRVCRELEREEFYKENPKAKRSKSYQLKLKVLKSELTTDQYELIRRLLARFKVSHYNYADYFRVVDVYIDIHDHEAHLDAYSENEQMEIMLRRLKDIWLHNKDVREKKAIIERDKLEKKRKRLLKD